MFVGVLLLIQVGSPCLWISDLQISESAGAEAVGEGPTWIPWRWSELCSIGSGGFSEAHRGCVLLPVASVGLRKPSGPNQSAAVVRFRRWGWPWICGKLADFGIPGGSGNRGPTVLLLWVVGIFLYIPCHNSSFAAVVFAFYSITIVYMVHYTWLKSQDPAYNLDIDTRKNKRRWRQGQIQGKYMVLFQLHVPSLIIVGKRTQGVLPKALWTRWIFRRDLKETTLWICSEVVYTYY